MDAQPPGRWSSKAPGMCNADLSGSGNSRDALCLTNNYKYPPNGGWARRLDLLNLPAASKQGRRVMTRTEGGMDNLAPACRRTRRASVPARLRARGRGALGMPPQWHQHLRWRSSSAATANGLRRSGTATRHVCGLGWSGRDKYQNHEVPSMRFAGPKLPAGRMDIEAVLALGSGLHDCVGAGA